MTKVLNPSRWPENDRHAWSGALVERGPFNSGPAAHWAARSRQTIASGYGRWIGRIAVEDPPALLLAPADRMTPERLKQFIAALELEITPNGVANYVKHTYDALRVMAPSKDWSWLKNVKAALERKRTPKRKRHRTPDPLTLLDLGLDLVTRADLSNSGKIGLLEYRDGLIIALLVLVPLRRRNLAGIEIGRNLQRSGDTWVLVFQPSETKNNAALEFDWPVCLHEPLERYLKFVRNRFPSAGDHSGLWPSSRGREQLCEGQIYNLICRRTQQALGVRVSPHLFRDSDATNLALVDPKNAMMAADLLGHEDFETTRRTYIIAHSAEASRRLASKIEKMRKRLATAEQRGELEG